MIDITKLAKAPKPKQALDIAGELDKALDLALAARAAAESGDHQKAAKLRAEHDAIFERLYSLYGQEKQDHLTGGEKHATSHFFS